MFQRRPLLFWLLLAFNLIMWLGVVPARLAEALS